MGLKLFIPCFLDQGAPDLGTAVLKLLERLGVPWEYPADQTCCGQFAYTLGDFATARRLMRHFLEVFRGVKEGQEEGREEGPATVLCPGASCVHLVRRGYPELAAGSRERRQVEALAPRVLELSQFLAARLPLSWTPEFNGRLVLHRSCKARQLGLLPGAAMVLSQVVGLTLLEVSPFYSCCGFGGTFQVLHPDLSRELGETYLEAVRATGARGLVSLDYSCLMHLKGVAAGRGWELEFFHLAEILLSG